MNREELVRKLTKVKPALSSNALVPILTDYWFTGIRLMAFNDKIAISTPYKSDFIGTLPGNILLALLSSSSAKECTFSNPTPAKADKVSEILITAGRTKMKLGVRDLEETGFDFPKKSPEYALTDQTAMALCQAIESCIPSLGNDPSSPDKLGVTLIPGKHFCSIFATDSVTITYAKIPIDSGELKNRVLLSGIFCKEITPIVKDQSTVYLEITPDHILLAAGGTILHGKLLTSDNPYSFESIVNHHYPPGLEKRLVQIPPRLSNALDRASIIMDDGMDDDKTSVEITGGVIHFLSKSKHGQVDDVINIGGHEDVKVRFNPKLVRAGCERYKDIMFRSDSIVMTNKGKEPEVVYLVSATS